MLINKNINYESISHYLSACVLNAQEYDTKEPLGKTHEDWSLVRNVNYVGFIDSKGNEIVSLLYEKNRILVNLYQNW